MVGLLKVEAKSTAEPADLVERRLEVERLEMKLLHGHQVVEAGGGVGGGGGGCCCCTKRRPKCLQGDSWQKNARCKAAAICRVQKGQRTAGFYMNVWTNIEISIAVHEERRWNN